ncbi:unnamed protein product, partial [Ilex paraguariensis]
MFEALLPNKDFPVVPPPPCTSGPTSLGTIEPTTSALPPTFVTTPRETIHKIGSSECEEEEEYESNYESGDKEGDVL